MEAIAIRLEAIAIKLTGVKAQPPNSKNVSPDLLSSKTEVTGSPSLCCFFEHPNFLTQSGEGCSQSKPAEVSILKTFLNFRCEA